MLYVSVMAKPNLAKIQTKSLARAFMWVVWSGAGLVIRWRSSSCTCSCWCPLRGRVLMYLLYPKIQHGSDWERSRPQGPKNAHDFLMTLRPLIWACGHGTEMLLILKKNNFRPDYSAIFSDMTVQRNVPRFCMRSICGWNLFHAMRLGVHACANINQRSHVCACMKMKDNHTCSLRVV